MSRILISGASGFIGSSLSSFFSSLGHEVFSLARLKAQKHPGEVVWDFEKKEADFHDFEAFDAIFHLAGEPLEFGRWSEEKKKKIFNSRVQSTLFFSEIIASLKQKPELFVCASACGIYGNRKEEILTEKSPKGKGFLTDVCFAWEKASSYIAAKGVRVVNTRFGIVLGANGGPIQKMLPIYKLGLGARLGSGEQWMSWIALDDLIRAMNHILKNGSLQGAINVVSPDSIRQEVFAKTLASILHRPCFLSVPAPILRWVLKEVADELLLASNRVEPAKLLESNFHFQYPDLRGALLKALKPKEYLCTK
jgi:uncharacterized protein (TIGR01777 family)